MFEQVPVGNASNNFLEARESITRDKYWYCRARFRSANEEQGEKPVEINRRKGRKVKSSDILLILRHTVHAREFVFSLTKPSTDRGFIVARIISNPPKVI